MPSHWCTVRISGKIIFIITRLVLNLNQITWIISYINNRRTINRQWLIKFITRESQLSIVSHPCNIRRCQYSRVVIDIQHNRTSHILTLLQIEAGVQNIKGLIVFADNIIVAFSIDHLCVSELNIGGSNIYPPLCQLGNRSSLTCFASSSRTCTWVRSWVFTTHILHRHFRYIGVFPTGSKSNFVIIISS